MHEHRQCVKNEPCECECKSTSVANACNVKESSGAAYVACFEVAWVAATSCLGLARCADTAKQGCVCVCVVRCILLNVWCRESTLRVASMAG
jgi:hypothetical protein